MEKTIVNAEEVQIIEPGPGDTFTVYMRGGNKITVNSIGARSLAGNMKYKVLIEPQVKKRTRASKAS